MRTRKWISAGALGILMLIGNYALAQGKGQGKGHTKGRGDQADYFSAHDRQIIGVWYGERQNNLPPGLAKRDRLPPGLEKQLVQRGTLPPGLQKRIQPCPEELERRLPPPPPDCAHVLIGGHLVLLNRRTNIVLDIVHLERR